MRFWFSRFHQLKDECSPCLRTLGLCEQVPLIVVKSHIQYAHAYQSIYLSMLFMPLSVIHASSDAPSTPSQSETQRGKTHSDRATKSSLNRLWVMLFPMPLCQDAATEFLSYELGIAAKVIHLLTLREERTLGIWGHVVIAAERLRRVRRVPFVDGFVVLRDMG